MAIIHSGNRDEFDALMSEYLQLSYEVLGRAEVLLGTTPYDPVGLKEVVDGQGRLHEIFLSVMGLGMPDHETRDAAAFRRSPGSDAQPRAFPAPQNRVPPRA